MRLCILFLFFTTTLFGQFTKIPDRNFELALIQLGYDSGIPNGKIPTASISTIKSLNISFKKIKT